MKAPEQYGTGKQDVLIISDDREFAREILGRWQMERQRPAFTLITSEMCLSSSLARFDLAIIGAVKNDVRKLLQRFGPDEASIVLIASEEDRDYPHSEQISVAILRRSDAWAENLVVLAEEMLRRAAQRDRVRHAEMIASANQKQATLGRYMQEMRHSFNNALTSVLGNAELLLLKEDDFDAEAREQVSTIRDMALNLHEMMQRFTSLECELQCATREPKQSAKTRAAGNYDA